MRIVSLDPAATEIVCALELGDDLAGISHECDFPPAVRSLPVVTRAPSFEADERLLADLGPDLVLVGAQRAGSAGADARRMERLRAAAGPDATVVRLDPVSLEGIFHAIATVGAMTDAEDEAVGLVEILRERLADLEEVVDERRATGHRPARVVALDGLEPLSAAGLWVPEQVRRAGGWELIGVDGEPGHPTTWDAVREVDPQVLLVLPRGLHLADARRAWTATPRPPSWAEIQAARAGRVFVLDGAAYFGRPGPRVVDGIELLAELFDPDAFTDLAPARSWAPAS